MKPIFIFFKFTEYGLSILIFALIIIEFLKRIQDSLSLILKLRRTKEEKALRQLRRLLLIKAGFLLPWETLNFFLSFVFAVFIFHWFSSSILIVSLTSFLFKRIVSEIPFLLLTGFYYFFRKPPPILKEDIYIKETKIIPPDFVSCLYIPQKATTIGDVYAAIGQGLRALRNNSYKNTNLIFIYHSDTEDSSIIQEEIRLILEARKEFGNRVFLFCRNRNATNPFFLKKPGAYMSDYQILYKGIRHPLTYLSPNFDGRYQKVLSPDGKIKDVFPFYPDNPFPDSSQFFIRYHRNLFIKEILLLKKLKEPQELFKNIEVITKNYLINRENPSEYYLVYQGAIFDSEGKVLFKPTQWKLTPSGEIKLAQGKSHYFQGKRFSFTFVNLILLNKKKSLILDSAANLIDIDTGKVWTRREDYLVEKEYDLYQFKRGKFFLIRKNIPIDKKNFRGEDYRRSVFDRMDAIESTVLYPFIREKTISPQEAEEFERSGIVGDIYKLHIAKNGYEEEFFIKDPLFQFKEKVTGGYLVKRSDGFGLDKEGNLLYGNAVAEPRSNLKELFVYEENGKKFLLFEDGNEKFFLKKIYTDERVAVSFNETYFYVQNPWIRKTKPCQDGFVVNQKDGFYPDPEGNIWFNGSVFKEIKIPIKLAQKDKVSRLIKERTFIDYKEKTCLKRSQILAESGSWYKDKEGHFRRRKPLAYLDDVYFREDLTADIFDLLTGEKRSHPANSYCLGENSLWQRFSEDDKIIWEENFIIQNGDLVKEEVMAQNGEYRFNPEGEVILNHNKIFPYGVYLRFGDGEILQDFSGNFVFADCGAKIVNQTDADAEFQPQTIPYINSQLIRNLGEEDPYLMYQPEIGFGNQGQSAFAHFSSWAQQMYRFTSRAVFGIYTETSAYGKMTKVLSSYVENILFKEAIPPLARTHDHWEAMHLKTALVLSYPHLKAKNLIENTPGNFFAFLKRQEGWIAGDLILLEYETYFGVVLDLLRAALSFMKFEPANGLFWLHYSRIRIAYLKDRPDTVSYLAKLFRIWLVKRFIFFPFYYGIWLILVGTVALILPGTLTIKYTGLAWSLFWATLAILIGLPKLAAPLLERFILSEKKNKAIISLSLSIFLTISLNLIFKRTFPAFWIYLNTGIFYLYLAYRIFIRKTLAFVFSPVRDLTRLFNFILAGGVISFCGWFYLPVLTNWLENIPSANWLFIFVLEIIPHLSGYLVPLLLILKTSSAGRTVLNIVKRGMIETAYSSSILLLNVIYIPLTVLRKIRLMLWHPHKLLPWITSPFIEKLLSAKFSLEEYYARLLLAPLCSISFVFIPVTLGLADVSLIFYGWPIFVWSWALGPYLAWLSGSLGQDESFASLEFSSIKDKLISWKNGLLREKLSPSTEEVIEKILELNLRAKHSLSQRELLRLYLYFLTDIELDNPAIKEAIEKNLKNELTPERLREYSWETLNELSRARIIMKLYCERILSSSLSKEDITAIKSTSLLIHRMGPLYLGTIEWETLPVSRRAKMINGILSKYKLSDNTRLQWKRLLQTFKERELRVLYKKIKMVKDMSSLILSIPPEFVYLRKAISDLKEIPDFNKLSSPQKKILLELTASRYGLTQKGLLKILWATAKLPPG